jgi:TPR repeat protein
MGLSYETGGELDFDKSAFWIRKAAEKGDPEGQNYLAQAYEKGEGVPLDAAEAFRLYLKAAEQDHVPSQRRVAELYAEGKGVEKNPVEAARWSRKYIETAERERKAFDR